MMHKIQISKALYKELLFHSDNMKSVDTQCTFNSITTEVLISILCSLSFPHPIANRFISLIDKAETRLNRQLDIHDRSKSIKVGNDIYKALNRIRGHETVSEMACIILKKGLAIMEMDLPELNELKRIYEAVKNPIRLMT